MLSPRASDCADANQLSDDCRSAVCGRRIVTFVMAITYRELAGSEDIQNKGWGSWRYTMKGGLLGKAAPECQLAAHRHWD
jgi:hypothetical protein